MTTNVYYSHYIVCRRKPGDITGPAIGGGERTYHVLGASRTYTGARRIQRRLGGAIRHSESPYRRYAPHEEFSVFSRLEDLSTWG